MEYVSLANELITFNIILDSEIKYFNCPLLQYKNISVLTNYQLSYLLEIDQKTLRTNFSNHFDEFEEDKDYFKLETSELKLFKKYLKNINFDDTFMIKFIKHINKFNRLYLWTEEGVSNHAKISNSKNAWKIFKVIKEYYFNDKKQNSLVILQDKLNSVENKLEIKKELDNIYIIEFDNRIIKVGKSKNLEVRIKQHRIEAGKYGVNISNVYTKSNSNISEIDLIKFCKSHSELISGKEYFKNLSFNLIVYFVENNNLSFFDFDEESFQ